MAPLRPFSLYRTRDQWLRAAHAHTAIDAESGGVQLARLPEPAPAAGEEAPALGAGLAFDAECRLYHSLPADGCVERILWASRDPLSVNPEVPVPLDLFATVDGRVAGDFSTGTGMVGPLRTPRGLAVDDADSLFIAETGARRVVVVDLTRREIVRRVGLGAVTGPATTPLDLAADGRTVWVITRPFALLRMRARSGPHAVPVLGLAGTDAADARFTRIAISPAGRIALLGRLAGPARVVAWLRATEQVDRDGSVHGTMTVDRVIRVAEATDVEFMDDDQLVLARRPGQDLLRWRSGVEDDPLKAKAYDGLGIVRTPDCRIGFWTARGFRHAVASRPRYVTAGRVTTYALDSGTFQTRWGRLFLDACIPSGTQVRAHFATSDELPDEPTLPRTPPDNVSGIQLSRPDLSPPIVPLSLALPLDQAGRPIARRTEGREIPWSRPDADDPFVTFDGQVTAPPGRYLWVTLDLRSDGAATPRVRCLRAERPGHDLMRRLPRLYSRDEMAEAFLRRYLAQVDGVIVGLEDRSADRRALLDPMSAPDELLPWLADFVGLVLDERWPMARRRELVAEAVSLFRFRGTVPGLLRFLEICLGVRPVIVEAFRVRGLGGAVLGGSPADAATAPILGAGFRIGGAVGDPTVTERGTGLTADAFATTAHRFSVIIPATLDDEQLAATAHLLEVHRPTHTLFDLCTVGAGIRVGIGIHLGLTTIVGRTGGFAQLRLGSSFLGTTGIIGRPLPGITHGATQLGRDSRLA